MIQKYIDELLRLFIETRIKAIVEKEKIERIFFIKQFIVILQYTKTGLIVGATKTDHFTDKQNSIAIALKALGHPARVAIVEYLMKVDTCICGEIVNELPLAQPTVSQHLKELKNAGLIKGSIEGNTICYCIDENEIQKLQNYFTHIHNKLNNRKNKCC